MANETDQPPAQNPAGVQPIDREDPQQQANLDSSKEAAQGEPAGSEAEGTDQSHAANPATPPDGGQPLNPAPAQNDQSS